MNKNRLTFYGGVRSVTGANFLLETAKGKMLVDCGLVQGRQFCDDINRKPFPYDPASVDAVCVTHAHLDHVGRLPRLVQGGFAGSIHSTPATKEIARLILDDALGIMQYEEKKTGEEPLYTADDIKKTFDNWETHKYHEQFIAGEGINVSFKDAGHILGSAIIEVTVNGKKIVFSGDLGNSPAPLLKETEVVDDANYLVVESVYGDRNHESVDERLEKLENVIENTVEREGTLMIPAFSIERTQTLLYEINKLVERGRVPAIPVFLDSPLAIRVTRVYKKHTLNFNEHTQDIIASGDDIFKFPKLVFTESVEESKKIAEVPGPKIVIAGSGMSHGGRILHHEKRYLPDPNSTLLIVGFQAAGSLGRRLLDGADEVEIHNETVPVRAKVRTLFGYSSHKDSDHLLEFVGNTAHTVKEVFVAMGEAKASTFLAQRIRDYLGAHAVVPEVGQTFELDLS